MSEITTPRIVEIGNVGNGIAIGGERPFALIAGPCAIEDGEHAFWLAQQIAAVCKKLGIPYIFKSSFDKANRTALQSYRSAGMEQGIALFRRIRRELGIPVLTDIHEPAQAEPVAAAVDIVQIPAFMCRQTDLVLAAGRTGKPVNVKKGQFLAPWDVKNIVEKIRSTGNENILLTERGTSFGYNNLVVDMRSLVVMRSLGYPVVMDATHAVQLPGGLGHATAGQREFIPHLARAAAAVGIDALFMEVHDAPEKALSDGSNMIHLHNLEGVLRTVQQIDRLVKGGSI